MTLTPGELRQALAWYVQGFDLHTIAQHFDITAEALRRQMRTH